MTSIYLDYNATTPLDPAVATAMPPFLGEALGCGSAERRAVHHGDSNRSGDGASRQSRARKRTRDVTSVAMKIVDEKDGARLHAGACRWREGFVTKLPIA